MKALRQSGTCHHEAGSALLIAIFALLLISVVGIALLVSTGSDSALAGNYRTSTAAYYAAVAGLEEARGRLLARNPDFINKTGTYSTLFTPPGAAPQGTTFGLPDVLYIVNPNTTNGEVVDPADTTSPYADKEYGNEFPGGLGAANVHTPYVTSVSPVSGFPGPAFKWVRINAVTESAINLDVDGQRANDKSTPLFYSGFGLYRPGSGVPSPAPNGSQALEITAFAYMPDKSTKYLQYVVAPDTFQYLMAPNSISQGFPAALILAGNGVGYTGPDSTSFYVNGNDESPVIYVNGSAQSPGGTCPPPVSPPVSAIGYTNSADQLNVVSGTSPHQANYTGYAPPSPAPATPSVGQVSLPTNLQTPSQLDGPTGLVNTITESADVVITPQAGRKASGSDLPPAMSPANFMTVVVNGDLDLTSWHNTGYGLLLVTGNLIYDPDASWEGVVLVIGQGVFTAARMGSGRFDGSVLVARTRDASGNLLPGPNLGASSVNFNPNTGGVGFYYNSCMILQALAPTRYQILSFREITQ
jgi:hypothetical protein